ncbi:MAG: hypothetical protein H0X67_02420 [Acidobacteria bacterium]|nr:hypothetical protein [Acidobacteriota bacterium]
MAARRTDAEIDRLYQLPLAEFTAARHALAKSGRADVKTLEKPTVPAWAVNQLYWHERTTYDALIEAAEAQRRAHKAVLTGRAGDLREPGNVHDQAVEAALKATLGLLAREGHAVTDATRQAILTTVRALPVSEAPGRLTRTQQPGGFEMLAGLREAATPFSPKKAAHAARPAPRSSKKRSAGETAAHAVAVAKARAQVEEAIRKLRPIEQAARREEFEAARAAREAEKAERQVAQARDAYEAAREALEEAEACVPATIRARDAAGRRAEQAGAALETARAAVRAAEDRLASLGRTPR